MTLRTDSIKYECGHVVGKLFTALGAFDSIISLFGDPCITSAANYARWLSDVACIYAITTSRLHSDKCRAQHGQKSRSKL